MRSEEVQPKNTPEAPNLKLNSVEPKKTDFVETRKASEGVMAGTGIMGIHEAHESSTFEPEKGIEGEKGCNNCGEENPTDAKTCDFCGSHFEDIHANMTGIDAVNKELKKNASTARINADVVEKRDRKSTRLNSSHMSI